MEVMCFWGKTTEVNWYSHHISSSNILPTWLITVDIDLDHLADVVLFRSLHCQVTPLPPSVLLSLEGSHYYSPHLGGVMLHLLKVAVPTEMPGNSSAWRLCLFSPSYLLIQSFVSICIHGYLFYTCGYNPILCYLFFCSEWSSFGS